jgi:peptidoglycan/LPS O-acetylase OafA/YrhL
MGQSMAVALAIVATVSNPRWIFSQLLETRVLRWVGSLAYSLYLWQQIFLSPLSNSHRHVVLQAILRIALAFLLAYLSYRFIEKPAIRLGHRLAPPPTPGRGDLAGAEANADGPATKSTALEAS